MLVILHEPDTKQALDLSCFADRFTALCVVFLWRHDTFPPPGHPGNHGTIGAYMMSRSSNFKTSLVSLTDSLCCAILPFSLGIKDAASRVACAHDAPDLVIVCLMSLIIPRPHVNTAPTYEVNADENAVKHYGIEGIASISKAVTRA